RPTTTIRSCWWAPPRATNPAAASATSFSGRAGRRLSSMTLRRADRRQARAAAPNRRDAASRIRTPGLRVPGDRNARGVMDDTCTTALAAPEGRLGADTGGEQLGLRAGSELRERATAHSSRDGATAGLAHGGLRGGLHRRAGRQGRNGLRYHLRGLSRGGPQRRLRSPTGAAR